MNRLRSPLTPTMPARYAEPWESTFDARVRSALVPGVRVLDVGSGRRPAIPVAERPLGSSYVALDVSAAELERAPAGSYDEIYVADVIDRVPELEGQFDLIVSFQVLEHVKPLSLALENLRAYLRPGGQLVAQLSGRFSAFGLINTVVPSRVGTWILQRVVGRDPGTVFPAYYDACWHGALEDLLTSWSASEILPLYRGAPYFRFQPVLLSAYLAYENWCHRNDHRNLATHYVITAVR